MKKQAEIAHAQLVRAYGINPHATCGDCVFFKLMRSGCDPRRPRSSIRCEKASSVAAPWSQFWAACGKFVARAK